MLLKELDCENVLLKPGRKPAGRLLVVFAAANAAKFTFYNSCRDLESDVLFIRDPNLNHWFQGGIFPGRDLLESVDDLKALFRSYDYVATFGSSMGGYAALAVGALAGVQRIVAIGPQTLLDPAFSRSPKSRVKLVLPDISDILVGVESTEATVLVGMLDGVDLFNSARMADSRNLRTCLFRRGDHFLPKQLSRSGALAEILHFATEPRLQKLTLAAGGYDEGHDVQSEAMQALMSALERLHRRQDYHGARVVLRPLLKKRPVDPVLRYTWAAAAFKDELFDAALRELTPIARRYDHCIEYNALCAEAALRCGDPELAVECARRVLAVRSSNERARQIVLGAGNLAINASDVQISVGLPPVG